MTNHHDAIVTAGVDFASQASNTATCSITWTSAGAVITELTSSCDDNFILELVSRVTKVGIDVPLGWPSPFVEALRMHAHDGSWPANYEHVTNLKDYRLRSTDNWVHETLKLPLPLSVATDRIAIPTMRAAALFARITPRPPLDGSGRVIEDVANATSGWLLFTAEQRATCVENDNVLDALIATLVSRAALTGLTESIPLALRDAATREGWIAIPRDGSLSMLAGPSQGS